MARAEGRTARHIAMRKSVVKNSKPHVSAAWRMVS
jgi:hypothetical protein